MKKMYCLLALLICPFFCFADKLDDEVLNAIAFLIPENNTLIEVSTPYYDETFAASPFSKHLKQTIETMISAVGKELFDYDFNNITESKIADYSDSGYSISKNVDVSQRKMPDGTLSSTFTEKNNTVTIFFEYGSFTGKKKSTRISVPTKDLPGLKYKPENIQIAKELHKDIENAISVAKQNQDQTIEITAAMVDLDYDMVNILHPGDIVNFIISCDIDCYIAIMGIDVNNNKYWLPVNDPFMKANEPRSFPDLDVDYQITDGIFGSEVLFIYASDSPNGLPKATDDEKYQPNIITNTTRGFMAVKKNFKKGVFAIPYTVIAE